MSWIELDDQILEHPKFIRAVKVAGGDAVHMWLGLRAYCAQKVSDGLIPTDMMDEVRGPREPRKRRAALEALTSVGLLEAVSEGVRLHDYLEWSSSRDEVLARRASARDRKRRSRANGSVTDGDVTDESRRDGNGSHDVTDAVVTAESQTPARAIPSPPLRSPSAPIPTQTEIGSGNGSEKSAEKPSPRPAARSSGTPIAQLAFRCDGDPSTWWVTQEQLARWEGLYPSLGAGGVLTEIRKAIAWNQAKPANQKTANGMPSFLVNWLNKAVNEYRGDRGPQGRDQPPRDNRIGHARADDTKHTKTGEIPL